MTSKDTFLIIDIGTGNVRVAVTEIDGRILAVERDDVQYIRDTLYPDALYFEPDKLWGQIVKLTRQALSRVENARVRAITASSQREGIVLLNAEGRGLIGLPNHDHRGREWENVVSEPSRIYALSGRYPSSLFSAMKIVGIRNRRSDIFEQTRTVVSISDWAQFQLSGVAGYEHSQASETQLYDVEKKSWSPYLCAQFGLPETILPPLHYSGTVLGKILSRVAADMNISADAVVVVGGADTQLAVKSTRPAVDDIVIVSGTTTPIVKIIPEFTYDKNERTWTNRHVDRDNFILEANAGVTGLNLQRLKEIFYPNEGYDVLEKELEAAPDTGCVASLGAMVSDEKEPLIRGGFVFPVPVSHELTRASFVRATLWDIACAIKANYDCLVDVTTHTTDYVWGCGGGLQSRILRQYVADLIDKRVRVRSGFQQASVTGGAVICGEALNVAQGIEVAEEVVVPRDHARSMEVYREWKSVRSGLKKVF